MRRLIKALGGRFIRGFAGIAVLAAGIELVDKLDKATLEPLSWAKLRKALVELWRKERDIILLTAVCGGVANICAELAHCVSRRLYRKLRRRA